MGRTQLQLVVATALRGCLRVSSHIFLLINHNSILLIYYYLLYPLGKNAQKSYSNVGIDFIYSAAHCHYASEIVKTRSKRLHSLISGMTIQIIVIHNQMILTIINEALCGERQYGLQQTSTQKEMPQYDCKAEFVAAVIVPDQFKSDIDNLKTYVGEDRWQRGLQISLSLQELLGICPRERKRSDAYSKLIKYLADEKGKL